MKKPGTLLSKFLVALVLFFAVNLCFAKSQFGALAPSDFIEQTWSSWAIDEFLKTPKSDVVFLGSSLMLVPLDGCDADFLQKKIDGSAHHRSYYFEHAFEKASGIKAKSFNFALPGQMPSDAYLITDFLLKGEKKPDVIVYGVGPRDFMDSLLPSPAATDPFKYLSRFGPIEPVAGRVLPGLQERFNFEIGNLCYSWGKKEDLSTSFNRLVAAGVNTYLPVPSGAKPMPVFDRKQLMPEYRPCQLGRQEAFFRPLDPSERPAFSDNLNEYRKRYRDLKWDTFLTQMEFLADTIDKAKERDVRFVLVAMPITDINRQLLADHTWNAYHRSLRALAMAKGVSFVDLNNSDKFSLSDFMDTVHLHAGGGRKMLDSVASCMAKDEQVCLALNKQQNKDQNKVNDEKVAGAKSQGGTL